VKGLGSFASELVVVCGATRRMPYPGTSGVWALKSSSATGPIAHTLRSPKPGGRSAPGLPFTCAHYVNSEPMRSAADATRAGDAVGNLGELPAGAAASNTGGISQHPS
jgi:hypothetical protein